MGKLLQVLLIDDDTITNFINKRLIQKMEIAEEVIVSQNGAEALSYIENKASAFCNKMPIVVILTTSSNDNDMQRLINSPIVSGFLIKPLTEEKMQDVYKEHFVA